MWELTQEKSAKDFRHKYAPFSSNARARSDRAS